MFTPLLEKVKHFARPLLNRFTGTPEEVEESSFLKHKKTIYAMQPVTLHFICWILSCQAFSKNISQLKSRDLPFRCGELFSRMTRWRLR